jgi:endo-1,4-beta-xylanase
MFKIPRIRYLSRRKALQIGIAAIAAVTTIGLSRLKGLSFLIYNFANEKKLKSIEGRTFTVVGNSSLKKRARAKGLICGALPHVDSPVFEPNPQLKATFVRDFDAIVAGFYWSVTRPTIDTFNFKETDYFAKFAAQHKLLLRGHPLIYHYAVPDWLEANLNRKNARSIFTGHIETVVKRYAGKMHSWDVVNEAIYTKDGRADGLRNTLWLKFLGDNYIDLAFRTAAKFDPQALLFYNEGNLEYDEAHQVATLKLLERLKSQGTPVRALGIQSHLWGGREDFKPRQFSNFLQNVADLGLKIAITELDVTDKDFPRDFALRDRLVAATYEDYLNTVLAQKAVIAVITWGFTDRHGWITPTIPRDDGAPARPLPFDDRLQPKLAWKAIARAFDRAPKRPS